MILQKNYNSSSPLHTHIITQCLRNNKEISGNQLNFPFMEQMSYCFKKSPKNVQPHTSYRRLKKVKTPEQLMFPFFEKNQ